jgi:hypothetical protein
VAAAGKTLSELSPEVPLDISRPLPSASVMADEALAVLRAIALCDFAEHKDRVAAAKAIREELHETPLKLLEAHFGSPEALLAWIDETRPEVLRQIAERDGKVLTLPCAPHQDEPKQP